jgi:hypothetical protein
MAKVFDLIPARSHATVLEGFGLFADAVKQANENRRRGRKSTKKKRRSSG